MGIRGPNLLAALNLLEIPITNHPAEEPSTGSAESVRDPSTARIRVNAVAPGFFLNPRNRKILLTENGGLAARGQNVMGHTPLKRFGEARELLGTVCWLLDDARAGFVTGIAVPVDGGFLASSGV